MDTFIWHQFPEVETWIQTHLQTMKCAPLEQLEQKYIRCSTKLFDWISHITLPYQEQLDEELTSLGFAIEEKTPLYHLYYHPAAHFPRIAIHLERLKGISLLAEEVASFCLANQLDTPIEGTPLSPFRQTIFYQTDDFFLACVERRGTRSITPVYEKSQEVFAYLTAKNLWETRPRNWNNEDEMMEATFNLAKTIVAMVGTAKAAYIVLEVERAYWQGKNRVAVFQKGRQDAFGLGWANQDHHTFRSSRHHFQSLIQLFEILGFHCRERFYAGSSAGWGAQVMENPEIFAVLFLDVDLNEDEVAIDFAHTRLHNQQELGTIGLWCALHGESIFQAGMHHLEAQFSFDLLRSDLKKSNIEMMDPFSHFTYLKQAFTEGEMWPVDPDRLARLRGLLSEEEMTRFRQEGAIGSHLENLERNEGFKGFNQKNVSKVIKETDPRN